MIFDTHLINMALAGLGISAGIAILMAVAIIGITAIQLHRKSSDGSKLTSAQKPAASAQPTREREVQAA